jgi:hypothetical protein
VRDELICVFMLNWRSFSGLAIAFIFNRHIIASALAFAGLMGILDGFLPAVRAARLNIVDALRAVQVRWPIVANVEPHRHTVRISPAVALDCCDPKCYS